jgi:LmbE family N-acetylglucosaminyl deacetylase
MQPLTIGGCSTPLTRVLVIGCHSDDIEIGCGATVLSLTRSLPNLAVTWVVLGAKGQRAEEARASAETFTAAAASREIVIHGFRDGFMPFSGEAVKEAFEALKPFNPQLVLTHLRQDLHQDHRLACELTWNTFRDQLILEYEVPKFDGDLGAGSPNVYVPLSEDLAREKVALVVSGFPTQSVKHWFDEDVFLGLMRLRGMEARSESGYAEAFTARKLTLVGA